VNDHDGVPIPWFTFVSHWATGYTFDAKASFAWGVGEVLAPETYETTHLEFNPYVDIYAYWNGYFKVWTYLGFLEFSTQISPFNTHLLDFSLQVPTNIGNDVCVEIGASTKPVHFEVNVAWSWPNCSFGILESWWIPI
jgi:hypothetical protein